jgi:TIR domain/WD domain, G-beta repeat
MAGAAGQGDKLNIFISYSRDDLAVADSLDAALGLAGFGTSIDRHGISGGEEWEKRLGALIRDADTVVFVLSPSSAGSKTCAWEVEEAGRLGKRILPVLCRPLEDKSPPPQLAALNYIYFYPDQKSPGSGFGSGLVQLASALNTDLDWLREHTRYLQRATEWDAGGRPANRLLSGPDVATAKAWAARRRRQAPEPTALQFDFIKASEAEEGRQQSVEAQRLKQIADALAEREKAQEREAEARKNESEAEKREAEQAKRAVRRTQAGLAAAVVLALVAGGFAVFATKERDSAQVQRDLAEKATRAADEQRQAATEQRDRAQKATVAANEQRDLAEKATRKANEERGRALTTLAREASVAGDQPTAMLLALEALPDPGLSGARPLSSEAAAVLHQAWLRNRETALAGHHGPVWSAAFSADGTHVVTASGDKTARVWDLRGERPRFVVLEGNQGPVNSASFSSDGTHVVTASEDGAVRVWDLRGEQPSFVSLKGHQDKVRSASFSPDGTHVVTASDDKTARGGICAASSRASSPSMDTRIRSPLLRSARTERMWSRRLMTRRHGCGICAASSRASSPSMDTRIRLPPRGSVLTERT